MVRKVDGESIYTIQDVIDELKTSRKSLRKIQKQHGVPVPPIREVVILIGERRVTQRFRAYNAEYIDALRPYFPRLR